MNIDFSKVKKSPVPASTNGDVIAYYRGDGIKILVMRDSMQVRDANDSVIGHRAGSFTEGYSTAEVKKLAAAMLNRTEQRAKPDHTKPTEVHVVKPRSGVTDFPTTFQFLTTGRSQFARA